MRCPRCQSYDLMWVNARKAGRSHWDAICMGCGYTASNYSTQKEASWAFMNGWGYVPGGC